MTYLVFYGKEPFVKLKEKKPENLSSQMSRCIENVLFTTYCLKTKRHKYTENSILLNILNNINVTKILFKHVYFIDARLSVKSFFFFF